MLPNLMAEMKRYGITYHDIAKLLEKSEKTARDKISGKSRFDVHEAMAVRDMFFRGMTIEYLFARPQSQ